MEVEDVTGVRLTTRWSSKQQRHLSIGNSLLGQVIEDDNGMLSIVSEPLTHGRLYLVLASLYQLTWGEVVLLGAWQYERSILGIFSRKRSYRSANTWKGVLQGWPLQALGMTYTSEWGDIL